MITRGWVNEIDSSREAQIRHGLEPNYIVTNDIALNPYPTYPRVPLGVNTSVCNYFTSILFVADMYLYLLSCFVVYDYPFLVPTSSPVWVRISLVEAIQFSPPHSSVCLPFVCLPFSPFT